MSQWYAVNIAVRRERAAIASLSEKGFAVFMPCETVMRRIGREVEAVHKPLFPGYLFVLCDHRHFEEIREVDTVRGFVRYMAGGEQRNVTFPLAAILEMQAAERAGHYDRTRAKPNAYRPKKGDKVRVTAGPWMNFVGKLLATPRSRRAQIMIEGPFGRGVTLDVGHLRAA